jgi:hypothetical protein
MLVNTKVSAIIGLMAATLVGHSAAAQVCSTPLSASVRGKVKFQPGHYVAIGSGSTVATRFTHTLAEISSPALNGKVAGIQKRYYWSDLNGPGAYQWHFEKLQNDIAEAALAGKKLSVMIMFKFSNDSDESPVPAYIQNLPAYSSSTLALQPAYALNADGEFAHGQITNFGHPTVRQHFVRFLTKLAAVVDNNNTVSSVVFPESAMGIKAGKAPYASMTSVQFAALRNSHIDGLLEVGKQASCVFKHTPFIQLTNYPVVKLPTLTYAYKTYSIGMGGPDIWLADGGIQPSYSYFPLLAPQVPIGLIAAGGNYKYVSHEAETVPLAERAAYTFEGYFGLPSAAVPEDAIPAFTVRKLALKAMDLQVNFLFWKKNGDNGDKYYQAFKAEIAKMGTPAQTIAPTIGTCPSNYTTSGTGCVQALP